MPDAAAIRDLFGPLRILWQNRSAFYSIGLDRFCPIGVVAALDHGKEYDAYQRDTGVRVLGVDRATGRRPRPSDPALENIVPELKQQIRAAIDDAPPGPWAAVCPLPCEALPRLAGEWGMRCVCHPAALGAWLGDKSNYLPELERLGLPHLAGRWQRLAGVSYADLSREVGSRFVVQRTTGSGGAGTYFVHSEDDYRKAAAAVGASIAWAAPELTGPSLNVNAVVLGSAVVVGPPSLQLSGLSEIRARRGTYCGNDFLSAATAGADVLDSIRSQTTRIGEWLGGLGFRGIFGLDFQVDSESGVCYVIDLNPRWQGSTVISTQAEALAGRLPLAAAEIAWKLGAIGESEVAPLIDRFFAPLEAAQMMLRSDANPWYAVRGDVMPGVYNRRPPFEHRRLGYRLEDLRDPDEVLVTGGVPYRGALVGTRATFARVYAKQPLLQPAGDRLYPWAAEFAGRLYAALDLEHRAVPDWPVPDGPSTGCREA